MKTRYMCVTLKLEHMIDFQIGEIFSPQTNTCIKLEQFFCSPSVDLTCVWNMSMYAKWFHRSCYTHSLQLWSICQRQSHGVLRGRNSRLRCIYSLRSGKIGTSTYLILSRRVLHICLLYGDASHRSRPRDGDT